MADPLQWNDGEGYDIHVLRTGPPSKALTGSFNSPSPGSPFTFTPLFKGAPNNHGVKVDTTTGVVEAQAHPNAADPKLRNFLMQVNQTIPGQGSFETLVRVHVHDSIQKMWLTPATLTIHTRFDECRFTVLALFDDGTVGDITDWTQIKLTSADPNSVSILPDGTLSAEPGRDQTEMEIEITATLKLAKPVTDQTAKAKAITSKNWESLAQDLTVNWVAGPMKPDETKPTGLEKNTVESVVKPRTNILFISEGFDKNQGKDFKKLVGDLVTKGLPQPILEPYKLLRNSINYWSLFVPSKDSGISLLGEYEIVGKGTAQRGTRVVEPEAPDPSATEWSVANMIHQVGLPVPQDPVQDAKGWVTTWKKLYDAPVTEQLVTTNFSDWNDLRSRTILNERDSFFGFAHRIRPRVSEPQDPKPLLRPAWRRPSEANILKMVERLTFGTPPAGLDPYPIGERWAKFEPDFGFVCFVCLSDIGAGEARTGYFAATTGFEKLAQVKDAKDPSAGKDIVTAALSDKKAPFSADIFAARVAHECGHACGLGDEYGPGDKAIFVLGSSGIPIFPNLQTKAPPLVTSATPPGLDPDQIKWRLPRALKVAVLTVGPDPQGGNDYKMRLLPGQGKPFKKKDIVQVRQAPLQKSDPYVNLRFGVVQDGFADSVDVTLQLGSTVDPSWFDPKILTLLICVNQPAGPELKLVAEPILKHIGTTGGPLNAPAAAPMAACVPTDNAQPVMSPTNLPPISFRKQPPADADILGLYEGGGHFDCGIFRPAGRCKMRTSDDTVIPFCHVCRYLIVDRIDASRLAALDKLYDPFYPL